MNKIPVAVLGATGAVGQRFIQLLAGHPWFEIVALAGSERSAGRPYAEACHWTQDQDPPAGVAEMLVASPEPGLPGKIIFSALPSEIARQVEPQFAQAGYLVCSNTSAYRQAPDVPLLIPELNADHLALVTQQRRRGWSGLIVTSPNCTTTGLAMTLKPLDVRFGVRQVFVTTMQAVSGAGYPGIPYLDIAGNLIPFIDGEEDKIQAESRLLLGRIKAGERVPADFVVSAQATRVPVSDGHTLSLAVKFDQPVSPEQAIEAFEQYAVPEVLRGLPSAPAQALVVRHEPDRPQPRRDRLAGDGMAVSIGRIRPCPLLDLRMVSVVHNTLRGAASGSILNAELLVAQGYAS